MWNSETRLINLMHSKSEVGFLFSSKKFIDNKQRLIAIIGFSV
jgi:hypothetical protein